MYVLSNDSEPMSAACIGDSGYLVHCFDRVSKIVRLDLGDSDLENCRIAAWCSELKHTNVLRQRLIVTGAKMFTSAHACSFSSFVLACKSVTPNRARTAGHVAKHMHNQASSGSGTCTLMPAKVWRLVSLLVVHNPHPISTNLMSTPTPRCFGGDLRCCHRSQQHLNHKQLSANCIPPCAITRGPRGNRERLQPHRIPD